MVTASVPALLVEFLRTFGEVEEFATPAGVRDWFAARGLIDPGASVSDDDVRTVRRVRAAVGSLLAENVGGEPDSRTRPTIAAASAAAPLQVAFAADGGATLTPSRPGLDGALSLLAGLVYRAEIEGTLPRLKACKACGWGFFDESKNRSRVWCDMALCGSQNKARAYRARKKQEA